MAYKFDGSSTALYLTSALSTTLPLWMYAWIKPIAVSASPTVMGIQTSTGNENGWSVRYNITPALEVFASQTGVATGSGVAAGTTNNLNYWACVVGQLTSSADRSAYYNSPMSRGNNTTSVSPAGMDRSTIGGRWNATTISRIFNGLIAEPAFGSGTLTPSQILALYSGYPLLSVVPRQQVLGYWPLRKETGITDFGPQSLIFTVFGTPVPVSDHPPIITQKRSVFLLAAPPADILMAQSIF